MIIALAVAAALGAAGSAADACGVLIPESLRRELSKAYPQYRLPLATDQDPAAVKDYGGGTGCLGVAKGDFDGDQRGDIALLLAGRTRLRTRLVVALGQENGWRLELIDTWVDEVSHQYLSALAPGTYMSGLEDKRIKSPNDGFAMGTIHSTATYFFRLKGRWLSLWMSD